MRNLALRSVFQAVNPAISVKSGNSLADGLKFCYVPNGQWNVKDLTGRTQQYGANSYGTSVADGPFGQSNMMYWSVGSDNTLLSGLKSLSISAIFKYTNTGSSSNLIVRKSYGFELGITYSAGTASLYFTTYVSSNGSTANTNSVTITVGQWYHCVVNQDASGNANVYLNGKLAFTVTPNGTTAPVFDYLYALTAGYTQFGAISNVSMWNRALTGGELSRLCANPLAMLDAGERWFAGVGASSSYSQTYSASSTASASRIRLVGIPRSGSAGSATALIRSIAPAAKSATASGTATRVRAIVRGAIAVTSSASASQIRGIARTISTSSAGAATMVYGRVLFRSAAALASNAASSARSIGKAISASSSGLATLSTLRSLARTYSASSAGSATAALTKQLYRAYAATAASATAIVRAISRTPAAASAGSFAAMVYGRILFRVAAATVSATATMVTAKIFGRVFSAASTAAASIGQRAMSVRRSATAPAAATATRLASLFRTISVAASATPSITRAFSRTFSAGASAIATAVSIFTSGAASTISLLRRVFVQAEDRSATVQAETRKVVAQEDEC